MLGLIVNAAIIGIIIAVMERGEFPGWGPCLICVAAIWAASIAVALALPDAHWIVGVIVASLAALAAIAWQFEMSMKRSAIAAGIFFAINLVWSFAVDAMMS